MHEQFKTHRHLVEQAEMQVDVLKSIAAHIVRNFNAGGKLYLLGNGGSAADSQHIAGELIGKFKKLRRPLPAIALTTDSSILTAITNDFGGEHLFTRQINALVTNKDVVWALSVSGTSPNVIEAIKSANDIGAWTIGFTGRSGQLAELCSECFVVDYYQHDRVQEIHQLAYHLICEQIESCYVKDV